MNDEDRVLDHLDDTAVNRAYFETYIDTSMQRLNNMAPIELYQLFKERAENYDAEMNGIGSLGDMDPCDEWEAGEDICAGWAGQRGYYWVHSDDAAVKAYVVDYDIYGVNLVAMRTGNTFASSYNRGRDQSADDRPL